MTLSRAWRAPMLLIAIGAVLMTPTGRAQSRDDVGALRERVREHYDVLALKDGIALVPRQRGDIRLIEIRGGRVTIDGTELRRRALRERLGADADTVLAVADLDEHAREEFLADADTGTPSTPPPAASAPPPTASPNAEGGARRSHRGDQTRVGGDVRVGKDDVVDGDVAAVIGSAVVDGEVTGDVSVVLGHLTLGPSSVVHGDVNVVGGGIDRAPTSRVDGDVHTVSFGSWAQGPWRMPAMIVAPFMWRVGSLIGTIARVAFIALLALVAMAVGQTWVERVATHAAIDPVRAGLVGFFAELAMIPALLITCVILAISIIGIPVLIIGLPFVIFLLFGVFLVGFTGVAFHVGRVLNERLGWVDHGPYATVVVGVVVIAALTILARSVAILGGWFFGAPLGLLGFFAEYTAWTVGFGAAIQVWLRRRRGLIPPPLPV